MTDTTPHVNVVLSDRNWILERLGLELQKRLPNIHLNDVADPDADINYYITFACRKAPAPTLEMAWFAHMERAPHLQELFVQTAKDIDLAVCHADLYADILRDNGIQYVVTIPPGVDLDTFDVALRIGVVGRTYHTGRKGERLIADVMDVPGIDWHFTGTGWPGEANYIDSDKLPDFYRSLDYVLVPALYEGGPMCVPEALAVGTPVIASDVGWVKEFPHIPFKNGDADDLRRVLTELVAKKQALRESTLRFNWDQYAEQHREAFAMLMGNAPRKKRADSPVSAPVSLLLHGNEANTKGGPSIRVPRSAEALRAIGVNAVHGTAGVNQPEAPLAHVFNVWSPNTALEAIRDARAAGKRVVFSPIYLDLSERFFWHQGVDHHLVVNSGQIHERQLAKEYAAAKEWRNGRGRLSEPLPGYNAMVREMISLSDQVILLSEAEKTALAGIGVDWGVTPHEIVHNPVDLAQWTSFDPKLFRDAYGDEDYVLCVGRIELRKNQLLLAKALKDVPIKLVLVGHIGQDFGADILEATGHSNLQIIPRLDPGSDMLRSAVGGAKVFTLPSWVEGASLAVLEAAATGANMVLSDRSSEREYFGDAARYLDPGSLDSIREQITAAINEPISTKKRKELQAKVQTAFSWETYARKTSAVYQRALDAPCAVEMPSTTTANMARPRIVMDITTLAHHRGRITGIPRVEMAYAKQLLNKRADVRFITWVDQKQCFIDVPKDVVLQGDVFDYRTVFDVSVQPVPASLTADDSVLTMGSAWMQNSRYVEGLSQLRTESGAAFLLLLHDLIPFKFPHWFERDYTPVFRDNFRRLTAVTDGFAAVSASCANDLKEILGDVDVQVIENGDPELVAGSPTAEIERKLGGKRIVLAVGAIHTRKNYDLLYRIWSGFAAKGQMQDLHLVIVGGAAWNGQQLMDMMLRDPAVKGRIHVLEGVDDRDLAWLYRNCLFTVFPSHYEGWGLPVAESLRMGKLCIATDQSSVPEIAPNLVDHLNPNDEAAWAKRIALYAGSSEALAGKEKAIQAEYVSRDWTDQATKLLDWVTAPRGRKLAEVVPVGRRLEAASVPADQMQFDAGWYRRESWGRWARSPQASVSIRLAPIPEDANLYVLLNLDFRLPSTGRVPLNIYAGQEQIYAGRVCQQNAPSELLLAVPHDAVDAESCLTIRFDYPTLQLREKNDIRQIGIGLTAVTPLDMTRCNPLHSLASPDDWSDGGDIFVPLADGDEPPVPVSGGLLSGWGVIGDGYVSAAIPILPTAGELQVSLLLRAVASAESPVTTVMTWNGVEVHTHTSTSDQPEVVEITVPTDIVSRGGPQLLELRSPGAGKTPNDLGIAPFEGVSGVGLFDIVVRGNT